MKTIKPTEVFCCRIDKKQAQNLDNHGWETIEKFRRIAVGNGYRVIDLIYLIIKECIFALESGKITIQKDMYGNLTIVYVEPKKDIN